MTTLPRPARRRELPPASHALVLAIRPDVLVRLIAAIEADMAASMLLLEGGQSATCLGQDIGQSAVFPVDRIGMLGVS